MRTVRLVHWNEVEARARAAMLRECGYAVQWRVRPAPELLAELKTTRASAVVIDLERLPSHGRDVGIHLRRSKATRSLPIVFVGGDPAKVARIREVLPDAEYASWADVGPAVAGALAHRAEATVVPASVFAPYANRPLAGKLGVRAGRIVALLHAPPDFHATLGELPEGVTFVTRMARNVSLAIWFVRSARELDARIAAVSGRVAGFPIWIAWPKKAAGCSPDLTQRDVRRAGLAAGLVDYKICSIDGTWSALLFRRRR